MYLLLSIFKAAPPHLPEMRFFMLQSELLEIVITGTTYKGKDVRLLCLFCVVQVAASATD